MHLDDWMDELEDIAFFEYGQEVYNSVTMRPFKWELMYEEGLTPEQALWTEFGS